MAHPRALIDSILRQLHADYDPCVHRFVIEKAIPGTRMMPDILITDIDGKRLCAVEIGYTRPEKLTAYRTRLHIPDVRWYDKSGQLHGDVDRRLVTVTLELRPAGLVSIYDCEGLVACQNEHCAIEASGAAADEFPENADDRLEAELAALRADVETTLVTDGVRLLMPSWCGSCSSHWMADPADEGFDLAWDLERLSAREFSACYGQPLKATWDDACARVVADFGGALRLDYAAAAFLRPSDQTAYARAQDRARKAVLAPRIL